MLATTAKERPFEWERHLQKVCFAYNTSVHASTGQTPFFLMFGRQAQLSLDLVFITDVSPSMTTPEYAVELKRSLEAAYEKMRRLYNRRVHGDLHQVGDHVWLHTTVLSRGYTKKLHHPWTGPYQVIKRLSDSTYRMQLLRAPHKRLVVHFNRLKPCGDAIEVSPPAEDTSVSGEPVPEPPVTGTRLDVVEPEDIPAPSEPHQPSPPVPTLLQSQHQRHRRYPGRNRQPPDRFGDLVPI